MKKLIKTIITLVAFFAVIPAIASLAITALWNSTLVAACGFMEIGFWHGVGMFLLGQILSGGFVLALFLVGGSIHKICHHDADWHGGWHKMTDEQRREFIERRRKEHLGFRNRKLADNNAAE